MTTNSTHFIEASLLRTPTLDSIKIEAALQKLIVRYPHLQLRYKRENGSIQQYQCQTIEKNYSLQKYLIHEITPEVSSKLINQWCAQITRQINIENGPVLVVGIIKNLSQGIDYIFFAIHRMFADRIGWRVLVSDLYLLYDNQSLPLLASTYQQWAQSLASYAQHRVVLDTHLKFWSNIEDKVKKLTSNCKKNGAFKREKNTYLVKIKTPEMQLSQKNFVLAATVSALCDVFETTKIALNLTHHGRDHLYKEIDSVRTVGYCQIDFPFVFELKESEKILETICQQIEIVPKNGISYAALSSFHPDKSIRAQLNSQNLPSVNFHYIGELDQLDSVSDWRLDTTYPLWENGFSRRQSEIAITVFSYEEELCVYLVSHNNDLNQKHLEDIAKNIEKFLFDVKAKKDKTSFKALDTTAMRDFEPIVTINDKKNQTIPYIILHPGDGGAESYLNTLYSLIPMNEKFILFNNYIYNSGDLINLPQSFESLANFYINFLDNSILTQGINLIGYSFGAVLAYEMAIQLEKIGVKIRGLYLIDPIFIGAYITEEEKKAFLLRRRAIDFFIWRYNVINKEKLITPIHIFKAMLQKNGPDSEDVLEKKLAQVSALPYNGLPLTEADNITVYPMFCNHYELLYSPYIDKIMKTILKISKDKHENL